MLFTVLSLVADPCSVEFEVEESVAHGPHDVTGGICRLLNNIVRPPPC